MFQHPALRISGPKAHNKHKRIRWSKKRLCCCNYLSAWPSRHAYRSLESSEQNLEMYLRMCWSIFQHMTHVCTVCRLVQIMYWFTWCTSTRPLGTGTCWSRIILYNFFFLKYRIMHYPILLCIFVSATPPPVPAISVWLDCQKCQHDE